MMKSGFAKPISSPLLIGRADELDTLCSYIDHPEAISRKVILISGEAGIGKSRLIEETKAYSLTKGFRVLQGNCFQADLDTPYAALIDILRTLFPRNAASPHSEHLGLDDTSYQEILYFFPELTVSRDVRKPEFSLDPEQEKRRLFALLTSDFLNFAKQQPLLLVIEDMHWGDESTREFLSYLARQSKDFPLILIITYRDDEISAPLQHWLALLDREHLTHELALSRLNRQDVSRMIQNIFALDHSINPELLDTLYGLTDGNPFFIEEVLKSLVATGAIAEGRDVVNLQSFGAMQIPRTVQDAVQRRLAALSEDAKRVITLAAVAGRRFDFLLLKNLLACDEQELLECIKELISAQLVNEESADQFAFRHALTRQSIYKTLLARERRTLHATIGKMIEQIYATSLSAHLGDLAYHFYEAESWRDALNYARRSGERALTLYTPQAAVEHFTRAIHAATQLGEAYLFAALYQARGRAYDYLGNFEGARLDYLSALETATHQENTSEIWASLIALGFLWSGRDYTQAGLYFQQALVAAIEARVPILEARSLNRFGNWLVNIGQPTEGLANHDRALTLFEANHDRQGLAETYDLLGMAAGHQGSIPNAVNHYGRAVQLFRELGEPLGLISSLTSYGTYTSLAWNETTQAASASSEQGLQNLEEALRLARQMGALSSQAYAEWIAAVAYGAQGKYGQGMSHAHQALQIASDIGHQQWVTAAHYSLGQLFVWLYAPDLAISELQIALSLAHQLGSAWWVGNVTSCLAFAYLLKKDLPHAEKTLEAIMSSNQLPSTLSERRMRWAWSNLFLAQGDAESALQIADELLESIPQNAEPQPIPWLLKLKADAFFALNQFEQSFLVFEQAAEGARQRGDYPLLGQVLSGQGWALRQMDRRIEAQSAFSLSRDIVARLAMSIGVPDLADQYLRATAKQFPRDILRTTTAKKLGGLTRREQEVAVQVSQGKSNGEVAETLVIGERTVETHVSNILSKLGLSSRRQIREWVANNSWLNQQ